MSPDAFLGLAHPSNRVYYDLVRHSGALEMENVAIKISHEKLYIIDPMGMNHNTRNIRNLFINETGQISFEVEVHEFREDMGMELWKAWRGVVLRKRD